MSMYVITIIPILRSINKESLSYLSSEYFEEGSIVLIPVRNKSVPGIVISITKAENQKSEIKKSSFQLKKLQASVKAKINPKLIMASKKMASLYATTPGAILGHFINENNLNYLSNIQNKTESNVATPENKKNLKPEKFAIQSDEEDRLNIYKSLIRESFAKKHSIFLVLPTEEKAKKVFSKLSKGIEDYVFLFSNSLSKKRIGENINSINESIHSVVIIATSSYLPFARDDIKTIIIEAESSRFYVKERRPYIDVRSLLEIYAEEIGSSLVYGDTLLRVETHFQIDEGKILEYGRLSNKINHPIQTLIVNTKKEDDEKSPFEIFSKELKEMISFVVKKNKKIFILVLRKGHSPETVCRDCGKTVLCKECEAPVVLHKGSKENIFICHHCGKKRSAKETCTNCGGWRLESFGIGIERVKEEINKIFSISPIIIESEKDSKTFLEDKTSIALGTEKSLEYLESNSLPYVAIASIDSLFAIPDFHVREKIMHILLELKSKSSEYLLIQGRNTEDNIIEQGLSGDLRNFIKEEIISRKKWGYPPFSVFIKITISLEKEKIKKEIEVLNTYFSSYEKIIFPAFIKVKKGKSICHMLIKIKKENWPDKILIGKLLSLPPYIEVRINPESLL